MVKNSSVLMRHSIPRSNESPPYGFAWKKLFRYRSRVLLCFLILLSCVTPGVFAGSNYATSSPTVAVSSTLIKARYIKLSRVYSYKDNAFNILGIDVYDNHGTFFSNQSTPIISQVLENDTDQFGPQYLIDGVHQEFKPDGSYQSQANIAHLFAVYQAFKSLSQYIL
jgi:hypothetical protein